MIYLSLSHLGVTVDLVNMPDADAAVRQLGSRLVSAGFLQTTYYGEGSVGQVVVRVHFNSEARGEWQIRRALAAGVAVSWAASAGHPLHVPTEEPFEEEGQGFAMKGFHRDER